MISIDINDDERAELRKRLGIKVNCETPDGQIILMNHVYEYVTSSESLAIVRTLYQRDSHDYVITCEVLWPTPSVNDHRRDIHSRRLRELNLVRLGRLHRDLTMVIQNYTREMSGERPL